GQGQGHLQLEPHREPPILGVDGAEGESNLEVVGVTHGGSPYWSYGGPSCMSSPIRPAKSLRRAGSAGEISLPIPRIAPLIAHHLASARQKLQSCGILLVEADRKGRCRSVGIWGSGRAECMRSWRTGGRSGACPGSAGTASRAGGREILAAVS